MVIGDIYTAVRSLGLFDREQKDWEKDNRILVINVIESLREILVVNCIRNLQKNLSSDITII